MRQLYAERRDRFIAAAEQAGAGLFQVDRPDSGMNAMVWLPQGLDDRVIAAQFVLLGARTMNLVKIAYLEEESDIAPGHLIMREAIEETGGVVAHGEPVEREGEFLLGLGRGRGRQRWDGKRYGIHEASP